KVQTGEGDGWQGNPDSTMIPDSITDPNVDCLTTFDVGPSSIRRLTRKEYDNTVRDLLGDDSSPASSFAEDEKVGGFDSNAVAPVSLLGVEQYQAAAESIGSRAAEILPGILPCAPSVLGESDCADLFIMQFGSRAWRRPLTPQEVGRMRGVYDAIRAEQSFQ